MPSTGWIHIWEQWSPHNLCVCVCVCVCVCLCVCVCVCVCVCGDEGSVSGLGKFASGPRVRSSESCDPCRLCWARPPDPFNPHQPALHGNGLFHPEGHRQMVVIQRVRPPGITGGSCNATCQHAQLSFPDMPRLPFSFPSTPSQFPLTSSLIHFPAFPSLSLTTSKPQRDCYEYIWHVWRHFQTRWHPPPLHTDIWRRIQCACVCSKICKSCSVETEVCYYWWQIQGWGASVGWLQVSGDWKQLNKRGGKVLLLFVSLGGGAITLAGWCFEPII